jgi:elongation factor 1 alpha-like protein
MGFTKAQAKTALVAECKGDVEQATDLLVQTVHAMASFDNMTPPPSIVNNEPTVANEVISSVAPPTAPEMSGPNTRHPKSKSLPPLRKPDVVPLPKMPSKVMTKIQSQNSRLSMVVLGHVNAGKSTLMGMVLLKLGLVQKRTVQKYQKQAAEVGKASFHLAWVMDEDESE